MPVEEPARERKQKRIRMKGKGSEISMVEGAGYPVAMKPRAEGKGYLGRYVWLLDRQRGARSGCSVR